jgi:NADPH-dependent 2,4-dienoyl-CoA reductase/sulfur reductase-like enzyme
MSALPVVVLGAGPVGLAAAAHLVQRDLATVIVEASEDVGASVRAWGHVRLFSPWRYDVDRAAVALLEPTGWSAPPPEELPTGAELFARYLRPLADVLAQRARLLTGRRVVAVTRELTDKVKTRARAGAPFVVRIASSGGAIEELRARAVIDASGTWFQPNPLGAAGVHALHEQEHGERIAYGIPDVLGVDRARYARRRTLVVGAGHSAANTILALAELATTEPGTAIVWTTRGEELTRVLGGGAADGLPARGALGAALGALVDRGALRMERSLPIREVRSGARGALDVVGGRADEERVIDGIDRIVVATGQRPEHGFLRELRLALDPALECSAALAPLIDPNEHSCGTVRPHGARELRHPEPDFWIIGGKSYGRAPTFLLATGYEQARSVVAELAGDHEAAARVELDLPATGVCSTDRRGSPAPGACC